MNFDKLSTTDKKSLYYPAISAVQKAVRRANFKLAEAPAVVAFYCDKNSFKRRLHTILLEDCCMDFDTMAYFAKYSGKVKTLHGFLELVAVLCNSAKCRESNEFVWAMSEGKQEEYKTPVIKEIRDYYSPWVDLVSDGRMKGVSYLLDTLDRDGFIIPDWLYNFLDFAGSKMDREMQGSLVPYLHEVAKMQPIALNDDVAVGVEDNAYENLFLTSTFDCHTMVGKRLIGTAIKKGMFEKVDELGKDKVCAFGTYSKDLLWYMSSCVLKNVQNPSSITSPCFYRKHRDYYFDSKDSDSVRTISTMMSDFEGLRMWGIKTWQQDFIDACQYAKDILDQEQELPLK